MEKVINEAVLIQLEGIEGKKEIQSTINRRNELYERISDLLDGAGVIKWVIELEDLESSIQNFSMEEAYKMGLSKVNAN